MQENPRGTTVPAGYRFFFMEYAQPADHDHPECQSFTQRLTLLHTSDTAPMVLYTGGYYVSLGTNRRELTTLLGANQLSVEHRFFKPSIPEPADWSLLTVRQSAADFHRIVQALKPIYGRRWLSSGGSKGGETVVFHRRFYPEDVDGTVAYVAPLARRDDERFVTFQDTVGGAAQAACRERLHTFQRTVLGRRAEMTARLRAYGESHGLTFNRLGLDTALEHAVIETYFAFWQYDSPEYCDQFPGAEASGEELLNIMDAETGLGTFADTGGQGLEYYGAYYYQAAVELGWPRPYETGLESLLLAPGTDAAPVYAPVGLPLTFHEEAMPDIQDWVSTRAERVMFIYGGLDPWSAAAYSLGGARDAFLYQVPGGNHGSTLGQLPEPQRTQALDTVRRWAGVTGLKLGLPRAQPQFEEFAPHLPPRLRPRDVP